MKRALLSIACLVIVSGSFIACGKKDDGKKKAAVTDGKVEFDHDGNPMSGAGGKDRHSGPAVDFSKLQTFKVELSENCAPTVKMELEEGFEEVSDIKSLFDERNPRDSWQLAKTEIDIVAENPDTHKKNMLSGVSGETPASQAIGEFNQKDIRVTCHSFSDKAIENPPGDKENHSGIAAAAVSGGVGHPFRIDRRTGKSTVSRIDFLTAVPEKAQVYSRLEKNDIDLKKDVLTESVSGIEKVLRAINRKKNVLVIIRQTKEQPRGQTIYTKTSKATYRIEKQAEVESVQ